MQADSVQWDLTSINHVVPWELRVLYFYFFLVLIFLLVRSAQLAKFYLRHRRSAGENQGGQMPSTPHKLANEVALASAKEISLRRAAILTFLFSMTVSAEQLVRIMRSVVVNKTFYPAAFAGSCSEILMSFSVGAGICTVLYVAFWFFENRLRHVVSRSSDPS